MSDDIKRIAQTNFEVSLDQVKSKLKEAKLAQELRRKEEAAKQQAEEQKAKDALLGQAIQEDHERLRQNEIRERYEREMRMQNWDSDISHKRPAFALRQTQEWPGRPSPREEAYYNLCEVRYTGLVMSNGSLREATICLWVGTEDWRHPRHAARIAPYNDDRNKTR